MPGPVFVELPIDTLYSVQEVRANMGLSARKRRKELDALPQPERDEWIGRIYLPEEAVARGQSAAAYAASKAADAPATADLIASPVLFIVSVAAEA